MEKRFLMRPLFPDTIIEVKSCETPIGDFTEIYFKPDIVRFYLHSDIVQNDKKFLMVMAVNYDKNTVQFNDVSDNVVAVEERKNVRP